MNEEVTMCRLIRSITLKQCFTEQVPALVGAAVIAELFYKFHSFVLKASAFLATWFVLDLLLQGVAWVLGIPSRRAETPASSEAIRARAQCPGVFFGSSNDRFPVETGPGLEPPPNSWPSGTIA
jgi:hypothetical protein